ncbi:hypothetical protein [Streptomyces sp. NPDC058548]|uniref:hypothetical protein n=1 Tax=Streptomyces sp. NPDC058548 TaxID=3346545 RepID=UPI00365D18D3
MTVTATRIRHFYTCTCDSKAEPHMASVQRVAVTPADADVERMCAVLDSVWHDATLFHGPDVPMVVIYEEGDGSSATKAAIFWAATRGIPAEPSDGIVTVRVVPEGVDMPADEWRPIYRYGA